MKRKGSKVWQIAFLQYKHQLKRTDFWIVLATVFLLFSEILNGAGRGFSEVGRRISFFEIFPVLLREADILFVLMIGTLFLISDIPRGHAGYEVGVLRTSRGIWYRAQWLYAVWIGGTYVLFIHLSALVFYLPAVNLSITSARGTPGNILREWFCYMILFLFLHMVFTGICCVCNLLGRSAGVGILINGVLIFLLYPYIANGQSLGFWSPVEVFVRYQSGNKVGFPGAIGYFICLCLILYFMGRWRVRKADIVFEAFR